MIDPRMTMTPASPVKPAIHNRVRNSRRFFEQPQDQVNRANMMVTKQSMRMLETDPLLSRGDIAHMHITVHDGVATLTGHVAQASNQTRAAAIVRAIPGVTMVVNHLVTDEELMITVAQTLGHNPQTEQETIQVNVQHGVVYLGGFVNRTPMRAIAGQVAATVPQVRGIINVIQAPGNVQEPGEEDFVQPRVGSILYATDGQVGYVQQVVIDPRTRRVAAVVVHAQFAVPQDLDWTHLPTERLQPKHNILIPIHSIRCADSGALFLTLKSAEAACFATFNPSSFVPPAAGWLAPFPYTSSDVLLLQQAPSVMSCPERAQRMGHTD